MVTNSQCKYKTRFTTLYSVCARFILFDCSTLVLIFAGSLLWLLLMLMLMLYTVFHTFKCEWRTHTHTAVQQCTISPSTNSNNSEQQLLLAVTATPTATERKIKLWSRARERGWTDQCVDCECLSFVRNTLCFAFCVFLRC